MNKKVYVVFPEKIGTIAPELYGHFAEHIGGVMRDGIWVGKNSEIPNIHGFRKEIIDKLKQISPAVIRWPGGCFAETYRWRDGIGDKRPVRMGWWTCDDGRMETNEVGIHEFISFCKAVGAKPYVAVNVTSITPMEAREWVEYCTAPRGSTDLAIEREKNGSPEPFDIPYWGIGNENWGGGGNMTPDYYALEYRRFSTVIDNALGKKPGRSELICGGANGADYSWTEGLTANLQNYNAINGLSFHYYVQSGDAVNFSAEEWYDMISRAQKIEELICRHYAIVRGHAAEEKMKLVIDEWGCWHPQGSGPSKGKNLFEQQSTMRDAVVAALTLNIFNNHCEKIKMANIAQLCNNLHSLFLTEGKHCILTPTFYVFNMFRYHQNGQAIRTLIDGNSENISISASVKDEVLTLTLVNLSCDEPVTVMPTLLGAEWNGNTETELLSGEDAYAHNTFEYPEKVKVRIVSTENANEIVLPPAAIVTVRGKIKETD